MVKAANERRHTHILKLEVTTTGTAAINCSRTRNCTAAGITSPLALALATAAGESPLTLKLATAAGRKATPLALALAKAAGDELTAVCLLGSAAATLRMPLPLLPPTA